MYTGGSAQLGQPDQVTLVQPGDPEYPTVHTTRAMQRRYLKYPWMTIGVGKSPDPALGPWVMYNLGLLDRVWPVKKPYRLWHTKKHLGDMFQTAQEEWDLAHPTVARRRLPVTEGGMAYPAGALETRLPEDTDSETEIEVIAPAAVERVPPPSARPFTAQMTGL